MLHLLTGRWRGCAETARGGLFPCPLLGIHCQVRLGPGQNQSIQDWVSDGEAAIDNDERVVRLGVLPGMIQRSPHQETKPLLVELEKPGNLFQSLLVAGVGDSQCCCLNKPNRIYSLVRETFQGRR
jgi:hypothetical protein